MNTSNLNEDTTGTAPAEASGATSQDAALSMRHAPRWEQPQHDARWVVAGIVVSVMVLSAVVFGMTWASQIAA